jgi:N-acetylneuraminic acid mutarotase
MKKRMIGLSVVIVTLALFVQPIWAGWNLLGNSMDVARDGIAGAANQGNIYAFGGNSTQTHAYYGTSYANQFSPSSGTWSNLTAMPTARQSCGAAVIGDYVYVIGGHITNTVSYNQRYNVLTNTWESKAPLTNARSGAGITSCNGKIYVIGGRAFGSVYSDIQTYDPNTNAWSTVSGGNMPFAGEPWSAVTLNNNIYVSGNYDGTNAVKDVWAYNPLTNAWDTSLPKMNVARLDHCLAAVDGRLYAIGGYNPSLGVLSSVESWAPGETSWKTEPSLNISRYQFGCGVIGNDIYAFGGNNGTGSLASIEVLTVPEPATLSLLVLGGLAFLRRRKA